MTITRKYRDLITSNRSAQVWELIGYISRIMGINAIWVKDQMYELNIVITIVDLHAEISPKQLLRLVKRIHEITK